MHRAMSLMVLLVPTQALAVSVYLNGTKVDGLTGAKMDKCSAEFDAKGNVLLSCPGYSVKVEGGAVEKPKDDAAVPSEISKHYFLVTEHGQVGVSDYDFDLFINSKFVRRLRNEEEQIVTEVTRHLQPGNNVVTFVAKKRQGKERKSFSPEHFFRVIIGEGAAGGDRVMIDEALVTFQKTAADTGDATKEFALTAR
ncbi:MAG: hypothetical protein HY901_20955 [Deltaproteobacteria bacterium]|nr:hypothetical protein [Deltaproteobacteria bacterium]